MVGYLADKVSAMHVARSGLLVLRRKFGDVGHGSWHREVLKGLERVCSFMVGVGEPRQDQQPTEFVKCLLDVA